MKILITGGAGFIGSHTARLLLDQGHQVVIYDLRHTKEIDHRALFIQGNISDQELLTKSLQGIDAVIHMASLLEVNESVKEPMRYAENNILGSISLVEAMRQARVKKIIFSSSATVYGSPKELPIPETAPVLAVNPYGVTKVAIENLLSAYHFVHKFDVTILRYFNPYGPGENHEPETHAIPNFIKKALKNEPIPLYWNGKQVRDFIYVEDLASAHISALDLNGWNVFNIGSGNGVEVIEAVNTIADILGQKLDVQDLGERAGDTHALYASSKNFEQATGWKSKVNLRDGLEKTIEWFKTVI